MELKDVTGCRTLGNYIKEHDYHLSFCENQIVLEQWPFIKDYQLVYMIKDSGLNQNLDFLENVYLEKTMGRFSEDYLPILVNANPEGNFWVGANFLTGWIPVYNSSLSKGYYDWQPVYQDIWRIFPGPFKVNQDYFVLYEDAQIIILSFVTRLHKPEFCNLMNEYKTFLSQEEWKNGNYPWDICRQSQAVDYSYFVQTRQDLYHSLGINTTFWMESYFSEQGKQLEENLRRKRERIQ